MGQVRAHILPGWLIETNSCWEKRERGRGSQWVFLPKLEQNGVTKVSFDRKDVMSLCTLGTSICRGCSLKIALKKREREKLLKRNFEDDFFRFGP